MKLLINNFFLFFLFFFQSSYQSIDAQEKSLSFLKNIKTAFMHSDISIGLQTPYFYQDQNFTPLPSYGFSKTTTENGITRIDDFNLNIGIGPNDLLNNIAPVGLSFKFGTIIQYYSLHQSLKSAYAFKPFNLMHLPVKAHHAYNHLKENHLVRFYAGLNLIASANIALGAFVPMLPLSFSGYYLISGNFKIQIQGLKDHRVRVRISTVKNTGPGVSLGLGLSYILSPIPFINEFITGNILYLNFLQTSITTSYNSVNLFEYVYNLNNSDAQRAYNELLSGLGFIKKDFKNLLIKKIKSLDRSSIFSPLLSETLALEDLDKKIEDKRVIKLYESHISSINTSFHLNTNFFIYTKNKDFTKKIRKVDYSTDISNINYQKYYNPTFFKSKSSNFLLGLFSQYSFRANAAVWDIKNNNSFINLGTFYLTRNFFIRNRHLIKMRKHLLRNLSVEHFKNIKWNNGVSLENYNKLKGPKDARFMYQLIITKNAYKFLVDQKFTKSELEKKFRQYWNQLRKYKGRTKHFYFTHIERHLMIKYIHQGLMQKNLKSQYLKLNFNRFFNKYGHGFLFSLLPINDSFYSIFIKLAGFKDLYYTYSTGDSSQTQLWGKLLDLNFDLNLPAPKLEDLK